jgi:hypothetical protein
MSGDPENRGPLMRLTADLDLGKQNLVANYAHQMGVSTLIRSFEISRANKKLSMRGASFMNIRTQRGGHLIMLQPAETSSVLRTSSARS